MGAKNEKYENKKLMWRIDEVLVGYHKDLAKQFDLEGKDEPAAQEWLPKLDVDEELPYERFSKKKKSQVKETDDDFNQSVMTGDMNASIVQKMQRQRDMQFR